MVLGIEVNGLGEEVDGRVPVFGRKSFVSLGFQQLYERQPSVPGLVSRVSSEGRQTRTSAISVVDEWHGDGGMEEWREVTTRGWELGITPQRAALPEL